MAELSLTSETAPSFGCYNCGGRMTGLVLPGSDAVVHQCLGCHPVKKGSWFHSDDGGKTFTHGGRKGYRPGRISYRCVDVVRGLPVLTIPTKEKRKR